MYVKSVSALLLLSGTNLLLLSLSSDWKLVNQLEGAKIITTPIEPTCQKHYTDLGDVLFTRSYSRQDPLKAMDELLKHAIPACRKANIPIAWPNWGLTQQDIDEMPTYDNQRI